MIPFYPIFPGCTQWFHYTTFWDKTDCLVAWECYQTLSDATITTRSPPSADPNPPKTIRIGTASNRMFYD